MDIFISIIVSQVLIVLGLWLFSFKFKKDDFYLFAFVAVSGLHLLLKLALFSLSDDHFLFDKFPGSFSLLYGPLTLFYFRRGVLGQEVSTRFLLGHSLPFIMALVSNIVVGYQVFALHRYTWLDTQQTFFSVAVLVSMVGYMGYLLLKNRQQRTRPTLSLSEDYTSRIVYTIALCCLASIVIYFSFDAFRSLFNDYPLGMHPRYPAYGSSFLMFFLILHFRIRLYLKQMLPRQAEDTSEYPRIRTPRTLVNLQEDAAIQEKLRHAMETEQLFRDDDLSLNSLAAHLTVPSHHLTEVINGSLSTNFYSYVNTFRIARAKQLLRHHDDWNLLRISHESGFKSKSTFNKYFKEMTGLTPSGYRKSRDQVES